MAISVHCGECDKTYQVRDEMAGRKGKCPRGHTLIVPAPYAAPAPAAQSDFDFQPGAAGREPEPAPRRSGKRAERPAPEPEPAEETAFAFPATGPLADRAGESPAPKKAKKRKAPEPEPDPEPPAEEDAFAFTATDPPPAAEAADDEEDEEPPPPPKKAKKRDDRKAPEPAPAEGDAEFAFPATGPVASRQAEDEEEPPAPKSARHEKARRAPGREPASGGKSMMPLVIGGALALLGVGGGVGLFFVGRSEVNPLREQLAEASKRADAAEQKAKDAATALDIATAQTNQKKNALPVIPKPDAAVQAAKDEAAAAKKKVTELERKLADLEGAMAKEPAAMPKDAKDPAAKGPVKPAGAPAGGKNWKAPDAVMAGMNPLQAGDRAWLFPKEDAAIKAGKGELKIKFRWQLLPGKALPAEVFLTVLVHEVGGGGLTSTAPVKVAGAGGDAEVTFKLKGFTGKLAIDYFLSDDNFAGGGKNLAVYSTFVSTEAEF